MKEKKRPRRSPTKAIPSFFRNLTTGDLGLVERARTIAGNLARRGGSRRAACCGHYGDPGC